MKKQSKPAETKTRAKSAAKPDAADLTAVSPGSPASARESSVRPASPEVSIGASGFPEDPAIPDAPAEIRKREITVTAADSSLETAQDFVNGCVEHLNPSDQVRMNVAVAVEEIFVNIAHYAYPPGEPGDVTIRCEADAGVGRLTVVFMDEGAPYNPLERPDPDVNLPLEERPIGGLGIFMTKRLMDGVEYRHEAGKNVLTIVKNLK
jgi:anti-sigma regulatory factor (Ser/Thr protein kinase)